MPEEVQDDDPADVPFDIIGTRRGIVCGVIGVDDWDMSRMHVAKEMVLYDFGGRVEAFDGCVGFQQAQDMRLADVDRHFNPGCTIVLGEGVAPPPNARLPIKIRVLAPHGFTHGHIRTFERCVEIIEDEAWDERPPCRVPRPGAPAAEADRDAVEGPHPHVVQRRLGAAPVLEPEQRKSRAKPLFQVPVKGFPRRLRPGYKGKDEFGNPVEGWTWVSEQTRHKKLPPREGSLGHSPSI